MKAKKVVKKINKALDYDMDSVLILGLESSHKQYHTLVQGEEEMIANLILNFFEQEPTIAEIVFKVSAIKKLNQIVTGESDEED